MDKHFKILISNGELSADIHTSKLVKELKKLEPNILFSGFAGNNCKNQDVKLIKNNSEISSNGLNIFSIIYKHFKIFFSLVFKMISWKPDLIIYTDYPDFNLRLAFFSNILRIPSLYLIPPKLWASRPKRIKKLSRISSVALIFPFEKDFYEENSYFKTTYIGHPFSDLNSFNKEIDKEDIYNQLDLDINKPTILILPGSRKSEIKRHLDVVLKSLTLAKKELSNLQAIISIAPSINKDEFKDITTPWIKTSNIDSQNLMKISNAGLLKSGTNNLEAVYCKLPSSVFYKLGNLEEKIIKKLVTISEYSLINIIKSKSVKEFIQQDAEEKNLSEEIVKLLTNSDYQNHILNSFEDIKSQLNSHEEIPEFEESTNTYQRAAILAQNILLNNKSNTFSKILNYLYPYKKYLVYSLIAMVIFGISDGGVPFLIRFILDDVFNTKNLALIYLLPVFLIAFSFIRAFSDYVQQFYLSKIGHFIIKDIRNDLNSHILKLSPKYFNDNSSADILSRITSDVLLVKDLLTNCISALLKDSIRIVALMIAAFYLDPFLALVSIIFLPLIIIPITILGKRIRKLGKNGQNEIGNISARLQETILGHKVVKLFNKEDYEKERFSENNNKLTDIFIKSEKIKAITGPINEIIASLIISGVILYGCFSVYSGTRTQGDFLAFLTAIFLMYEPIKKISKLNNHIQLGLSGADRIFEVLETVPSIEDVHINNKDFNKPKNFNIEFKNVNFSYSEELILNNINLKINEGSKIAIVGFSGSGKSTLINLLPRFIDPQVGEIQIGNVDIKELPLNFLRKQIAMVDQHTFLFNDTISKNIAYGIKDATKEQIVSASKAAFADNFIINLPDKYNSIVGEAGLNLSGGERQRIAIARAILKNAPILILDEATASLDNQSELEVQKALDSLLVNKTSIIIAHRLSTIKSADLIVTLENGEIKEIGKHDELLNNNGTFAKLHKLQFNNEL